MMGGVSGAMGRIDQGFHSAETDFENSPPFSNEERFSRFGNSARAP